jgi:hypothetical protein
MTGIGAVRLAGALVAVLAFTPPASAQYDDSSRQKPNFGVVGNYADRLCSHVDTPDCRTSEKFVDFYFKRPPPPKYPAAPQQANIPRYGIPPVGKDLFQDMGLDIDRMGFDVEIGS